SRAGERAVIELYAITAHPGPSLPDVAPLREVSSDGLSAVFTEAAGERSVTAERLWHHEHVVETLMDSRDLLPVRYGTRMPDEDAACRILDTRRDELTRALGLVRGAVELSVRVFDAAADGPDARTSSGSEYLRERARRAGAAEAATRTVQRPLQELARADAARQPTLDRELMRSAFLVDRERVARFTRAVADLQAAHPALRLLCTGPWPPYSFAQR